MEFKIRSPRGIGKPSHTDAMVLASSCAVAVESKWTEPRGGTIGKIDELSENKLDVLEGWLDLLRPHAAKPLCADEFSGLLYQAVHRAASACFADGAPCLIYLQFHTASQKPAHPSHYFTDLTDLYSVLGRPAGFPFYLVELPIAPTDSFNKIAGLKKGLRETDKSVRTALLGANLFDFGQPVVRRIGQAG